jgi:hypothetical protein
MYILECHICFMTTGRESKKEWKTKTDMYVFGSI